MIKDELREVRLRLKEAQTVLEELQVSLAAEGARNDVLELEIEYLRGLVKVALVTLASSAPQESPNQGLKGG